MSPPVQELPTAYKPVRLSDCQKTTVLSLRDPEGVVAISQNHLASCMYSGEYETFLLDCHVASLLAMTCRGLFRHAGAGICPRRPRKRRTVQTNRFVRTRQFLHRRGDVCERRLRREKRAKRSGRIKAIGKRALPAQTEPLIQQNMPPPYIVARVTACRWKKKTP